VKAGFDLLHLNYLNRSYVNAMGNFIFSGSRSGNSAADFLLGASESMTVASPVLEQSGRQMNTYYFVQDDWKIHPRFTLNLGLRYELPLPWVHPGNEWVTYRRGQQSKVIPTAPVGMVFPNDPGVPRGLIQTDKNNFAPRIGFAWDPAGNGKTSVRGAFGIFYETMNSDIIQNSGQPFAYTYTFNAVSLSDPLRGQPPIPLQLNLTNPPFVGLQQLFYPDPSLRSPYVQQFHLDVQREVVRDLSVQVGYVGTLGRKLLVGHATNPPAYGPGATLANIDQRRYIEPGFGNNRAISSEANSQYNSLQVQVNKRFSHGFSAQGAYTFSRAIDMSSAFSLGAQTPNVLDLHSQVGLADFHASHIASASWIWDLPRLASAPAAVRFVAGGWQLNGLISGRTGQPLNIVTGTDNALSGTNSQRPNVTKDPKLPGDRSKDEKLLAWFDRTAFVAPAAGTYGNTGRNALIGPRSFGTNLGILKLFNIPGREGMKLQFRSEFFSITNTPNFGDPNVTLSAGVRMGRITSASGARVIQLAMKMLF
jgi:hypothetical protein